MAKTGLKHTYMTSEDIAIIDERVSAQAAHAYRRAQDCDAALMRKGVAAVERGATPRIVIEVYGPTPYRMRAAIITSASHDARDAAIMQELMERDRSSPQHGARAAMQFDHIHLPHWFPRGRRG